MHHSPTWKKSSGTGSHVSLPPKMLHDQAPIDASLFPKLLSSTIWYEEGRFSASRTTSEASATVSVALDVETGA